MVKHLSSFRYKHHIRKGSFNDELKTYFKIANKIKRSGGRKSTKIGSINIYNFDEYAHNSFMLRRFGAELAGIGATLYNSMHCADGTNRESKIFQILILLLQRKYGILLLQEVSKTILDMLKNAIPSNRIYFCKNTENEDYRVILCSSSYVITKHTDVAQSMFNEKIPYPAAVVQNVKTKKCITVLSLHFHHTSSDAAKVKFLYYAYNHLKELGYSKNMVFGGDSNTIFERLNDVPEYLESPLKVVKASNLLKTTGMDLGAKPPTQGNIDLFFTTKGGTPVEPIKEFQAQSGTNWWDDIRKYMENIESEKITKEFVNITKESLPHDILKMSNHLTDHMGIKSNFKLV